ncbi:MAG: mannose-1-phosphate guanylyltransferase/mannose-6-phosphate isomerase [Alphaproteobacteria bacterium]
MTVHPVVLSGGSGTRLWPVSRALYPKQLLPLVSTRSMFQETLLRLHGDGRFAPPLVVCNDDHRFIIAEQMRSLGVTPAQIVLEPLARNTAPAVAVAALMLTATAPDAVLLVLPSDHTIADAAAFRDAVMVAAKAAESGALVTFGIKPTAPETGYGYIKRGESLSGAPGCFLVDHFVEKPDRPTAQSYIADGTFLWNSGMFLFRADCFLAELARLQPMMLDACKEAVAKGRHDLEFERLDKDAFGRAPSISIDYAVMEHTRNAAVVPVEIGWNDVGSWSALWEITGKDGAGNVTRGDVMLKDVTNSYVRSDDRFVAAIGVEDLIVVATDDAVLVASKDRVQDVRAVTDHLKASHRTEHELHTTVYRPWGSYQGIGAGERYQVKRIVVKPGGRLSLQKHAKRAEHWVVVRGTATVTRGDQTMTLRENESTFIPLGVVHRLENRTGEPLVLIEVQSGGYLGEDDIVRLDDSYGRN